jgi:hypothetical protein
VCYITVSTELPECTQFSTGKKFYHIILSKISLEDAMAGSYILSFLKMLIKYKVRKWIHGFRYTRKNSSKHQ